jgi:hypothetical protein
MHLRIPAVVPLMLAEQATQLARNHASHLCQHTLSRHVRTNVNILTGASLSRAKGLVSALTSNRGGRLPGACRGHDSRKLRETAADTDNVGDRSALVTGRFKRESPKSPVRSAYPFKAAVRVVARQGHSRHPDPETSVSCPRRAHVVPTRPWQAITRRGPRSRVEQARTGPRHTTYRRCRRPACCPHLPPLPGSL